MSENKVSDKLDPQGLFWAFFSYLAWGFFPVYWKLLSALPALEILAHRMLWSFVFYLLIFLGTSFNQWTSLFKQTRRDWLLTLTATSLITLNWGIYIYAVNTGHILEGSLAYFINPILNVAVGVLFFKESFPFILKLAVGFASIGVAAKIYFSTGFPWISVLLALTFCAYGVTKKLLKIPARTSSVLEGALGLIPATAAIFYFQNTNPTSYPASIWFLLVMGGVVTGLPLFLFAFAAQRIPYSVMGMLQFIAPSLQFLVGVFMFKEAFGAHDFITFGFIWAAMALYITFQLFKTKAKP